MTQEEIKQQLQEIYLEEYSVGNAWVKKVMEASFNLGVTLAAEDSEKKFGHLVNLEKSILKLLIK